MKASWIFWWIITVLECTIFFSLSILLWNRNVDAAGALQTLEIKLLNILVLGAFFLIPAIIQLIWCIVNIIKVKESNKSNN
ncbi:DUF3923 family protein [Staphylococcus pseudintermedius]|uniref:DUF3923 family protein n=2 Tax=Staphylococcus pseudintermedius TaxID=283734 RepID=UPI000BBBFA7E|nr:DUF3923 family protein [Staphylococcus pseudintermedius]EGQ3292450.1 DUF3923 family protein [Staphylococcus pseudintermedius]EGQ3697548.1 DUF3923 family protein [Staphylococcus pseudintermedius]EGQ3834290.1 DUF3923 family protein [Staphylococcus pseudintermedius]EGQ4132824.1 DUF3923 family protein [Staphylococcus pseudintermedius]EGQ4283379.1 DUF3923 family protein [Staphylococcus pseudintermedius]